MHIQIPPLVASVSVLLLLYGGGVFTTLFNETVDALFFLRGKEQPTRSIIIIGVDEKSQKQLGPWPFSRSLHADLLEKLSLSKVVGFDFLFTSKTIHDTRFHSALAGGPPVVLAVAHGKDQELLLPSPILTKAATIGHVETLRSGDGVVREVHLNPGGTLPSFALALSLAMGNTGSSFEKEPRLINFLGADHTFLTLAYADVISGKYTSDFFKNSIVLVGAFDQALGDFHTIPPGQETIVPGVIIQANILHNLLNDNFLKRCTSLSVVFALMIVFLLLHVWPMRSEIYNCAITLIFLGGLVVFSLILFRFGYVLEIGSLLLSTVVMYLFHLLFQVFSMARLLLNYFHSIEKKITSNTAQLFHAPPNYLELQKPSTPQFQLPWLQYRYRQLETAGNALDLQYAFIKNILSDESPPLILWERETGEVSLTNKGFDELWQNHQQEHGKPPDFSTFWDLINHTATSQTPSVEELFDSPNIRVNTDILLPENSGGKKYFRVSLKSFTLSNGQYQGILAGLTDVTEIKEMERIKDEVVSIVSHELKLPLTAITGYGEMLEDSLEGKHKEYAKTIREQTQRLSQFINDFLSINRLEKGRETLNLYPFDLIMVIEECISAVTYTADNKKIRIHSDLPAKVSPLLGDELLLLQAIINILENGLKYSPDDTTLSIVLKEYQEKFQLSISDEGPGIPQEEQEVIFNKFTRGKHEASRDGFGLGLNFTQQVITLHKGKVTIDTTTPTGTTVVVTLPKIEK